MPEQEVVGDHDPKIEESIAMDEAARMHAIDASQARIADVQRQVEDALENQRTHSVSHMMRNAGQTVGTVGAGALGAPGILADMSGYFAGKSAEELTVLLQALGAGFENAHQDRVMHGDMRQGQEARNDGGLFPYVHVGRQEA